MIIPHLIHDVPRIVAVLLLSAVQQPKLTLAYGSFFESLSSNTRRCTSRPPSMPTFPKGALLHGSTILSTPLHSALMVTGGDHHDETKNSNESSSPAVEATLTESKTYDVIIVGGGLAGLALSIGLAINTPHLSVAVIEKRPSFTKAGATLSLAKNGSRAINMLCDGDETLVQSIRACGIDMEPIEDIPVTIVTWWLLRDALLNKARELSQEAALLGQKKEDNNGCKKKKVGTLDIFTGMSLEELKLPSTKASPSSSTTSTATTSLREEDSTTNYEQTLARLRFSNSDHILKGKLIIGADGVHSSIRNFIGMEPAINTNSMNVRGNLVVDSDHPLLSPLLNKGLSPVMIVDEEDNTLFNVVNHHQQHPGVLSWNIVTPRTVKGTSNEELLGLFENYFAREKEEERKKLNENEEDGSEESIGLREEYDYMQNQHILAAVIENTNPDDMQLSPRSVQDMSNLPLNGGWGGRDRVTLIGDAAHACRPTDGQGGNMALEDCAVLCSMLKEASVDVLESTSSCNDLIRKFEEARLPRVKRIHDDQRIRAEQQGKKWTRWTPEFMDWVYNGSFT